MLVLDVLVVVVICKGFEKAELVLIVKVELDMTMDQLVRKLIVAAHRPVRFFAAVHTWLYPIHLCVIKYTA